MRKKGKRGLVVATLFIMATGTLRGQNMAQLSADTILLGDQTILSIPRSNVYPSVDQLNQNGIEALRQEFDSARGMMQTTLTSFEPGVHYIKLNENDSLPLTVLDIDVDTTTAEIRDITPIENVPYTFGEIIRWILLGLGIGVLSFTGWWAYSHRRKIPLLAAFSAPVDTRTPMERALDNLETLRKKQLWQSGRTKEYHTELTDTVRTFIEESTGIHATEMTSEECVNALMGESVSADTTTLLRNVFITADLVKFAKREPLPYEHQRTYDNAVEFVKKAWEETHGREEEKDA